MVSFFLWESGQLEFSEGLICRFYRDGIEVVPRGAAVELVESDAETVAALPEPAKPMIEDAILVEPEPCICGGSIERHASGGECSHCPTCHLYVSISDAMESRDGEN